MSQPDVPDAAGVMIAVEYLTCESSRPGFETVLSRVPAVGECLFDFDNLMDETWRVHGVTHFGNARKGQPVAAVVIKR